MNLFSAEEDSQFRDAIKRHSSTMCLVKWQHATVNLAAGTVKSCCHNSFRHFDSELHAKGYQFHETLQDLKERKMLRQGQKPKDCATCWWLEDQGQTSDRMTWSQKEWMKVKAPFILESQIASATTPTWLEVNFTSQCNFKCAYCSPSFSSQWYKEIQDHGPYPITPLHNDLKYNPNREYSQEYDGTKTKELFWKWFEEIYPNLKLLKITGGEPLLGTHPQKLFKWILSNENPKMDFSINSNLCPPDKSWNHFLHFATNIFNTKNSIQNLYLHPSIDCFGERAEYIRFGLDFKKFQKNLEAYLEHTKGHVVFISSLNSLSLAGLERLWEYVLELKRRFYKKNLITIDTQFIHQPNWLNINILPREFEAYIERTLNFAENNLTNDHSGFMYQEIEGLKIALRMLRANPNDIELQRTNLFRFLKEHDRRRGTQFRAVFPELGFLTC